LPPSFTAQQRRKFFYDLRHYFWDDSHLYKGVDGIMRRCVPEYEQQEILRKCHGSAYGGHHAGDRTTQKVLQSGFIGLPFLKMLESLFYLVMNAKELVISLDATKCI
jgi:hypothetical protein